MRKNPFSIYDFLGYVFPGTIGLIFIFFIYWSVFHGGFYKHCFVSIEDMSLFCNYLSSRITWDDTLFFVLIAYCLGHLIAYISSLSVEKFSIWIYGYPSEFLMGKPIFFRKISKGSFWKDIFQYYSSWREFFSLNHWRHICELLWRLVVSVCLFPITVSCIFLGAIFRVELLYIKPLDSYLQSIIKKKTKALLYKLGGDSTIDYEGFDFHRIIYNYEYEHMEAHRHKMDNYVAIYGFMRALTLIVVAIFDIAVWYICRYDIEVGRDVMFSLFALMGLSYILFLSFMKFYRRFTLESFMCIATDDSIGKDSPIICKTL